MWRYRELLCNNSVYTNLLHTAMQAMQDNITPIAMTLNVPTVI